MSRRNIGAEIIEGLGQAIRFERGEVAAKTVRYCARPHTPIPALGGELRCTTCWQRESEWDEYCGYTRCA